MGDSKFNFEKFLAISREAKGTPQMALMNRLSFSLTTFNAFARNWPLLTICSFGVASFALYQWRIDLEIRENDLKRREVELLDREKQIEALLAQKREQVKIPCAEELKEQALEFAEPYVIPLVDKACEWLNKPLQN